MTKQVLCGNVPIGGVAPIPVQSMTNTNTADVQATLAQIRALAQSGCDIVRVSVFDAACAAAVRPLVDASPVPLVADIHFDWRLAIAAIENGIHKLRINPGNIGGAERVKAVADCARAHHVPIRIGVNSGSVEKGLLAKHGGPTPAAMVESALEHVRLLEDAGFGDTVIAVKASDVPDMVAANRLLSGACDYPLHLGVTEAGLPGQGTVKSAIGIGALLLDGIGDTVRVSLSGDPVQEAPAAISILRALGLRAGVDVIACPTCGRTEGLDVAAIARQVEEKTATWTRPLKVAVMGCVVNGPGEAREADLGIAGGRSGCVLFRRGQAPERIDGNPADALMEALETYREMNG